MKMSEIRTCLVIRSAADVVTRRLRSVSLKQVLLENSGHVLQ